MNRVPRFHGARRAGLVAAAALLACGCSHPPAPAPPPQKVTCVHPLEREVTEWDEFTARFEAVESVEIRPRVTGYLVSVGFKEGSIVKKDDLLFVIDPRPYEATLHRAEAELNLAKARQKLAKANYDRVLEIKPVHAVSEEEVGIRESTLRQSEATVAQAQAAVEAAKLDVEFTRITAPVSGRVSRAIVT